MGAGRGGTQSSQQQKAGEEVFHVDRCYGLKKKSQIVQIKLISQIAIVLM